MIKINSLADMEAFANIIVRHVEAGDLILLNGDLGAGKTTLSQFIGKALGVRRNINSPTFNIIKSYRGTKMRFHHMDCYRLEESEEDLGFEEFFEDHALTVIEWSQFIEMYLPHEHLDIFIRTIDEHTRMVELQAYGEHYQQMKEGIIDALSTH